MLTRFFAWGVKKLYAPTPPQWCRWCGHQWEIVWMRDAVECPACRRSTVPDPPPVRCPRCGKWADADRRCACRPAPASADGSPRCFRCGRRLGGACPCRARAALQHLIVKE